MRATPPDAPAAAPRARGASKVLACSVVGDADFGPGLRASRAPAPLLRPAASLLLAPGGAVGAGIAAGGAAAGGASTPSAAPDFASWAGASPSTSSAATAAWDRGGGVSPSGPPDFAPWAASGAMSPASWCWPPGLGRPSPAPSPSKPWGEPRAGSWCASSSTRSSPRLGGCSALSSRSSSSLDGAPARARSTAAGARTAVGARRPDTSAPQAMRRSASAPERGAAAARAASPASILAAALRAEPSLGADAAAQRAPIDVFLRIRPAAPRERGATRCVFVGSPRSVYVDDRVGSRTHRFDFEGVIDSTAGQDGGDQGEVFDAVGAPVVRSALEGYPTCVFSLGQTGTGKTHTVIGSREDPGLLPRILERLLGGGARCRLSCLELHMDRVRDLLADGPPPGPGTPRAERCSPEVRCLPGRGVTVTNLSEFAVDSPQAALRLVSTASKNRCIAKTSMNAASSRGHGVFQLTLGNGARLCIVDLAGRENEKTTGCRGQSLAELSYINRSLFHLTSVIQALSRRPSSRSRVPFRDSKLTLLLSECLQSARASVVATVSPVAAHLDDTLATLRLARTVRQIATHARAAAPRPALFSPPARPASRPRGGPALLPDFLEVGAVVEGRGADVEGRGSCTRRAASPAAAPQEARAAPLSAEASQRRSPSGSGEDAFGLRRGEARAAAATPPPAPAQWLPALPGAPPPGAASASPGRAVAPRPSRELAAERIGGGPGGLLGLGPRPCMV